jgi:hypothetical protein
MREQVTLVARGRSVVALLPFDVREAFGRVRAPVRVTVNGELLRTTIATYGGESFVGFNAQFRAAAGIAAGDEVVLEIERDDEPRIIELPEELIAAMGAEERSFFETLSRGHRREFAEWVGSAARPETRRRRAANAVARLADHKRTPM